MSRSWADQIEAEDQDQDEDQVHEDQDPGAVEGEVRPTAEVPTTRSSTRMPARAASRTRERTAEGRSPVAGGMQSGAAGGGARVVTTEPIDLWVDPILRQLWHEQKKVSEMQDTELAAYVLDSKDKMPPRKMILLLLFLQKQSLAFAVYLFGIGTLHTGPGLKKKTHVIMLSP